MEREKDAKAALRELHDSDYEGCRILVEESRGAKEGKRGPQSHPETRILVKGLAPPTTWQDLKDFGQIAGSIRFAEVFLMDGGKCGMLEYETRAECDRALSLFADSRLGGRTLRLCRESEEARRESNHIDKRARN